MTIREATFKDAPAIRSLLVVLGYKTTISMLIEQLEKLFGEKHHQVFVYELDKEVVGFISVHFLPQLGSDGEVMIITFLSADESKKQLNVKEALERHVSQLALKRKCDRIQVHCADWRVPEHQFYKQQGYLDYPNYYTKRLVYAE